MTLKQSHKKKKISKFVGWTSVGVAILGGIDLIINFTLFDVIIELFLLFNVAVHWKYLTGRAEIG
ncbi:MAG: hypothetical protein ABR542_06215 [Desulfonatronovibrio sp.]